MAADQFAATGGEDGWAHDQTCSPLLAVVGRKSFDETAVRGDGAADCRAAGVPFGPSRVDAGVERPRIWERKEVGMERCVRNRLKDRQFRVSGLPKVAERPFLGAEGSGLE